MARLDSRRPRAPVIALLALSRHLRLPEVGRVADGSHRRQGVHLPWVLGAASNARILWSSLIVGALLVMLALWSSSLEHGSGAIATRR
jgi:SPW repeat